MPVYRCPSYSLNSLYETARSLFGVSVDCFAELDLAAIVTPVSCPKKVQSAGRCYRLDVSATFPPLQILDTDCHAITLPRRCRGTHPDGSSESRVLMSSSAWFCARSRFLATRKATCSARSSSIAPWSRLEPERYGRRRSAERAEAHRHNCSLANLLSARTADD